jgi:hypothetical protein
MPLAAHHAQADLTNPLRVWIDRTGQLHFNWMPIHQPVAEPRPTDTDAEEPERWDGMS